MQLALPKGGEDECRKFYVGVLGLTEVQKPPVLAARGGLWVRADNLEIHLGAEEDFRPQEKAHPGIVVGDIDALARRIDSYGLDVEWDDNFPGMRRFYLWDNNGNRLEFLSPRPSNQSSVRSGGHLAATFMRQGLIDEFRILVRPVVLGQGWPLFAASGVRMDLRLEGTRTFGNSVALLHYSNDRA